MDEDKLKDFFEGYRPHLSSSEQFMDELQNKMAAVEFVRERTHALKRRNRLAVAIAAVCGFSMGVVFTLALHLIDNWLYVYVLALPTLKIHTLSIDGSILCNILTWTLIAIVCGITSVNAYEIAIARLFSYKKA